MKLDGKGEKVQSESYGSNRFDILIIACKNCNSHKEQRLLTKDIMYEVLTRNNPRNQTLNYVYLCKLLNIHKGRSSVTGHHRYQCPYLM